MVNIVLEDGKPSIECFVLLREFGDVFLEETLELPRKKGIQFTINIVRIYVLIWKDPYHMSVLELATIEIQLQELLDKNYVIPSVSSWGTSSFCQKRKMRHIVGFVKNIEN